MLFLFLHWLYLEPKRFGLRHEKFFFEKGIWFYAAVSIILTLLVWMAINSVVLIERPFDPYPFILLNLFLSCLAAIQAPVIMMSQNRQEDKDRVRSELDYKTNLKAELEIRHLHIKMDQMLSQQWQRLLEIQTIQTELLKDLSEIRHPGR